MTHLRGKGIEATGFGPAAGERVDYPDEALKIARGVADGSCDRGVLICGTGIGVSMAANKVKGIRAALVHDHFTAQMAAQHNQANILCLGGRLLAESFALDLIDVWLDTEFEARHQPRLNKLHAIEDISP